MEAGEKERARYVNIDWLMPSIDLNSVIERLGIRVSERSGEYVIGFCPDHHIYLGRSPSHPKWYLHVPTGKTFCHTEGRGSNLLWTTCRLLSLEPDDAARFLTGKDLCEEELRLRAISSRLSSISSTSVEDKKECFLDDILEDLENRFISQRVYDFFIHPPLKKLPTNIHRDTVDRYRVFERTWGYYSDRAIIPYFMHDKLVGFSAIDLLGKDEWLNMHPAQTERQYRKVRYPSGFERNKCLFGYDDCSVGAETLVLTEGAREVMKLTQEGFANSVAILGSFLSDEQVLLITKLSPKSIALLFDGDEKGYEISDKVFDKLVPIFSPDVVRKCRLPLGFDPKNLDGNDLRKFIFEQ